MSNSLCFDRLAPAAPLCSEHSPSRKKKEKRLRRRILTVGGGAVMVAAGPFFPKVMNINVDQAGDVQNHSGAECTMQTSRDDTSLHYDNNKLECKQHNAREASMRKVYTKRSSA